MNISPILTVFLLNIFLEIDLTIGLIIGIIMTFILNKTRLREAATMVKDGLSWKLIFVIIGVIVFQQMVKASNVANVVTMYLQGWGIPILVVSIAITIFVAMLTGSNVAAVGLSFPMFLAASNPSLPLVSLLYVTAFLGYLISPLHLCLTLTCEHFNVDTATVYHMLIPPTLCIFVIMLIMTIPPINL